LVHGRARLITSNVATNAQLVALNPGGLQILEEATGGNVFLTTVYAVGMQAKSGETTFFAACSSHLVLPPGNDSWREGGHGTSRGGRSQSRSRARASQSPPTSHARAAARQGPPRRHATQPAPREPPTHAATRHPPAATTCFSCHSL
jgi:hypothetical protein